MHGGMSLDFLIELNFILSNINFMEGNAERIPASSGLAEKTTTFNIKKTIHNTSYQNQWIGERNILCTFVILAYFHGIHCES